MEKFIRRQNVEHYMQLLAATADEGERQRIIKLLAEDRQKQKGAGDNGERVATKRPA
jgi:hypothetical protein